MVTCDLCGYEAKNRKALGGHRKGRHPGAPTTTPHGGENRYADGCRCDPCRAAHYAYKKKWREANPTYDRDWMRAKARRRRRGSVPQLVCDYLETHGPADTCTVLVARINDRHPDIALNAVQQAVQRLKAKGIIAVDPIRLMDPDWLEATG